MSMLDPDYQQERPDPAAVEALWRRPVFTLAEPAGPAVEALLGALDAAHVNGGAGFARFEFADDPCLRWFVSRNRFDEIAFKEHLLTSGALRAHLPGLEIPAALEPVKWEWWSSYLLAGDWARSLMQGGAYGKFQEGARKAIETGEKACAELFGDRHEEVMVFRTGAAWSGWFYNVAWDMTWVGIDKRERKAWLLCLTDTD